MNKSNQEIISNLKNRGFEIHVAHYRVPAHDFQVCRELNRFGMKNWRKIQDKVNPGMYLRSYFMDNNCEISPRGGRCVVIATDKNGAEFVGIAECSIADNYCRSEGVRKALGRLIGVIGKDKVNNEPEYV